MPMIRTEVEVEINSHEVFEQISDSELVEEVKERGIQDQFLDPNKQAADAIQDMLYKIRHQDYTVEEAFDAFCVENNINVKTFNFGE